jgi:hypothetical protein
MKWMMDAGKGPATQASDRRPIDEGSQLTRIWKKGGEDPKTERECKQEYTSLKCIQQGFYHFE